MALELEVNGAPVGATATLDGKPVKLPIVEATPGEPHSVVVTAPGFVSRTLKVTGELGETKRLDASLDKVPTGGGAVAVKASGKETAPQPGGSGKLMVSASGGWCNVSVDGKPQGATPTGTIELSAGGHSVSCTDANGKTVSQGAKVSAGETTRVKFSL